jgi:hypothetical protein
MLHRAGLDANAITAISGHKSVDSLKSGISGPSRQQQKAVSSILHTFGNSEVAVVPHKLNATNTVLPSESQVHYDDNYASQYHTNSMVTQQHPSPLSQNANFQITLPTKILIFGPLQTTINKTVIITLPSHPTNTIQIYPIHIPMM